MITANAAWWGQTLVISHISSPQIRFSADEDYREQNCVNQRHCRHSQSSENTLHLMVIVLAGRIPISNHRRVNTPSNTEGGVADEIESGDKKESDGHVSGGVGWTLKAGLVFRKVLL